MVSDLAEDDKWVAANVARLLVGLMAPLRETSDGGSEEVWPTEVRWLVARELRDKPWPEPREDKEPGWKPEPEGGRDPSFKPPPVGGNDPSCRPRPNPGFCGSEAR